MSSPAAFQGTYSDMRPVKSRKVLQIVVEIPIEQGAAFVAAFGMPNPGTESWVALAKLVSPEAKPKDSRRWDELSPAQQAGIRCAEKSFWAFLTERGHPCDTAENAAAFVRSWCGVRSRADIAGNERAEAAWLELDGEYLAWMRYAA
ncbi:hypothetical protein [Ancylobacter oerskovii]|uniref:Uncharacterized protein n=1 Tax=Ancylobacter oerskovii TaxID=459519 RepID=A0ABW4Z1F1_9HYPH|nr:hypothetical protein [Ancylobacter oerskovii]MBS7545094.1 hypothetical protein [Ancylobacter oerskovii]